jgi:glycosyltransferase involved in cell wall biosynthesis
MRVAIVHPWFPQYRKAFFDRLLEVCSDQGIQIDIFHGSPPPEWQQRGDSVNEEYATRMKTRFFSVRGKNLVYKSPSTVWKRGPYDVLILEQAVRNLETYAFILRPQGARIAFWGHGKTYTKTTGKIQEYFKQFLTRRGKWFFSYTPGGGIAVAAAGFPSNKITIVQNSVDSSGIMNAISGIAADSKSAFKQKYDLRGKTGLFIGGLDASKRLDFLIEAADRAYASDPEFRLVVVGSGSHQNQVVQAAVTRPWVAYLGSLFGEEKALAMDAAEVLLMPGRVGLVAVDSFASGTPILTTAWPFHAPEFEYLQADHNAVVTENSVEAYSRAIVDTLNDAEALSRLRQSALESAHTYTISNMVANFMTGLISMREETNGD